MINSTQAFLDPIERWAKAVREDDFTSARAWAESLSKEGEMLAQHPDFQRCFTTHCGGFDPRRALAHVCQFLICATEGRAQALGHQIAQPAPPPSSLRPDGAGDR